MEPAFLAPAYPLRKNFLTHPTKTSFAHAKSIAVRNRRIYDNHSASTVRASADAVPEKLAWVDALDISGIAPGSLSRVVVAGLDVVVACDYDGQVYALGNKGTPLGVPLSGGSIVTSDDVSFLKCPQYGTLFDLRTGQVKDKDSWVTSPFLVAGVIRALFPEPQGVPVYQVRESGGVMQVLVNVNARAQYEQRYWKGMLDASGKADGGYY